jgi:hypothetical protein
VTRASNFKPTEIPDGLRARWRQPLIVSHDLTIVSMIVEREHRREVRDGPAGLGLDALVDVHLHEDVRDPPRAPPADEFER